MKRLLFQNLMITIYNFNDYFLPILLSDKIFINIFTDKNVFIKLYSINNESIDLSILKCYDYKCISNIISSIII